MTADKNQPEELLEGQIDFSKLPAVLKALVEFHEKTGADITAAFDPQAGTLTYSTEDPDQKEND